MFFFSSQEEEDDAVDETDQDDWRTKADSQVRLDHKVKHSGNLTYTITLTR